jgi:signal peptidase II
LPKIKVKYLILVLLSLAIVLFDQATKYVVVARFRYGESIPVWDGFFSLTYVRNTGAAFGLLAQANPAFRIPFFVIVPLVALVAIAFVFRRIGDRDYKMSCALSLVIGGAVGNLIDRVTLNYVVDFLDFHWKYLYHFPAFNVADTAICVGVGLLMLDLLTQKEPGAHASAAS